MEDGGLKPEQYDNINRMADSIIKAKIKRPIESLYRPNEKESYGCGQCSQNFCLFANLRYHVGNTIDHDYLWMQ